MTTHTELLEIVNNGENSGVEFKRDTVQNHDLAKELVAFSNLAGGMILLGIEDDGSISGITRGNLEEWVMTTCRDKIRPAIIPFYEVVRGVEPGKDVAIVRVTRGFDVHSLWHQNGNKYYIRVGTQSREAAQEELRRLFQQRGAIRAELQPVSGAVMTDLDRRRLQDYFGRVREQEVPDDDDEAGWRTLLVNTEIMTEEGVSVGGMLLFGKTPNRFLPHAGIDAMAFLGTEKDYAAREHKALRGPITPLLDANGEIVENGLVEQTLEFVRRNAPGTADLEGGRRVEKPAYPPEALREGIVNALIHRDYLLTSTGVELSLYSDRLAIISPGRLPNGITPERMRAGTRAYRNHLLKEVMRDYRYLEHMGMGIPRKIIAGMQKHNGTEPELIEEGERFILVVRNIPAAKLELTPADAIITVHAEGDPLPGVDVLVLHPNKTWRLGTTDEAGEAAFGLHSTHLPITVYAAAAGYASQLEREWIPRQGGLLLELNPLPDGGSAIFFERTGHLPGLRGRLNPIRDTHDRTYLYADNIAIDQGRQQPVDFRLGKPMRLTDAYGFELSVRILDIVGKSALVEYRKIEP